MELAFKAREGEKKGDVKKIRREGDIPAILYSSKTKPQKIIIHGAEFSGVLRQIKSGHLPTTVFTLHNGGKKRQAIVKDIQYDVTTYIVSHLDFEELIEDVPVAVKVPVSCTGIADCVGVKLGGFLRQIRRHVKVQCLPRHIPQEFLIDVKDLGIRQTKRLKDIAMKAGVKSLVRSEEVLVVVAKR